MRIRDARGEDETFVLGLVPRFVEHGAADGHAADEVIAGTRRVLARALRERGDATFAIVEDDDGAPLGFAYAVVERDFFTGEAYLHVSEIATAASGRGAGAALMAHLETHAAARGYRFVTLNVVEENRDAQRFYARRGFRPGHRHLVKRVDSEAGDGET